MAPRDGWLARQIDKITAQEPSMRMALRFTNGGGRGMTGERLFVRFDGPPSHDSGRFVELETEGWRSVGPEESGAHWYLQDDGTWLLGPFSRAPEAAPSTDEGEARQVADITHNADLGGSRWEYRLPHWTTRRATTFVPSQVEAAIRAPLEGRIRELESNFALARSVSRTGYVQELLTENARLREALRRISQYREGTEQPHEVEVMRGIANGALATPISSTKNTKNVRSCRRRNSQRLRRTRNGANPQDSETTLASERQRVRRAFVAGAEWALEPYRELLEAAREYRDELAEVGVVVREDDSVTRLLAAATALNEEGAHDAND